MQMPTYQLNSLGANEFERLSQSLLKEVIGNGTITFGAGRDGAREATFEGKAPYPSRVEQWNGSWIFQVKFHDTDLVGMDSARKAIIRDVDDELSKVVDEYGYHCDNFIMITNVPLSSVAGRGTHDRIMKDIMPKYTGRIKNIRVWGADDISRFLEKYGHIRSAYMQFLTTGDVIQQLLSQAADSKTELAETIRLYLSSSFKYEQNAQLLQAGDTGEDRIPLQKVFIDLEANARDSRTLVHLRHLFGDLNNTITYLGIERRVSAVSVLLSDVQSVVLIGGPGQGKSTVGQYIAQIHRATLLKSLHTLNGGSKLTPMIARIPFRVLLKEYAQWMNQSSTNDGIEFYLADRIKDRAGRDIRASQVQEIFKSNPCLLILDGLDEVTDQFLQTRMIERIFEFLDRCEEVFQSNIQVLATSRPIGYTNQFDPSRFHHLVLANLTRQKVNEYVKKWTDANMLEDERRKFLESTLADAIEDKQLALLMNTPLQITILILIVLSGGAPPRQREALFNEYLEVMYKREKSKARWMITTEKEVLFGLHQYLGYLIHSRAETGNGGRDLLTTDEFTSAVRTYLEHYDDTLRGRPLDEQVARLVNEARERLVLIVEPTPGQFGFELRSLLEFFAAGHLNDTAVDSTQRQDRFAQIARQDHWRNVALFFAGRLARQNRGEAPGVVQVCRDIDLDGADVYLRRGVQLALDLSGDRAFGPHRNLQRSTISYALTALDQDVGRHQMRMLKGGLEKLPKEDIKDYVKPELRERLIRMAQPFLSPMLELYTSLVGTDDTALRILARFLASPNQDEVLWALNGCLTLNVNPQWLIPQLPEATRKLTDVNLISFAAKAISLRPIYARRLLFHGSISETILTAALHESLRHDPRPFQNKEQVEHTPQEQIDLANMAQQIAFAVKLKAILSEILEDIEVRLRRSSVHLESIGLVPISNDTLSRIVNRIESSINMDYLVALASNPSALAQTRSCAWALLALAYRNEPQVLDDLASFFNEHESAHEWMRPFFFQWLGIADSALVYLFNNGNTSFEQRKSLVLNVADLPELESRLLAILESIEMDARDLKDQHKSRIVRALVFRQLGITSRDDDLDMPKIPEIFEEALKVMGQVLIFAHEEWYHNNALNLLLRFIGVDMPSISSLEFDTASNYIISLSLSPSTRHDAVACFNLMLSCDLDMNEKVINKVLAMLRYLREECSEFETMLLEIQFDISVKLLLDKRASNHAIDSAIISLSDSMNNTGIGQFHVKHFHQLDLLLRTLGRYIESKSPKVRMGAILIVGRIVSRMEDMFLGDSDVFPEGWIRGGYWSSEFARTIFADGSGSRLDGIRLLACSKVSPARDLSWMFETMKEDQSEAEINAWSYLNRHVRISKSKSSMDRWCAALSAVLVDVEGFSAAFRFAALKRYESLVRLDSQPLIERKTELGLPLNH